MPTTLGKYTIGKTLGTGASCKVKLAKDDSDTRFAIKILSEDEDNTRLIKTEIAALSVLKHPNIVNLIELGRDVYHNPKK